MNQVPRGRDDLDCPLWKRPMSKVCHKCPWWQRVEVTTEKGLDVDYFCSQALAPYYGLENAKKINELAASIESLRNVFAEIMAYKKLSDMASKVAPHLLEFNGQE